MNIKHFLTPLIIVLNGRNEVYRFQLHYAVHRERVYSTQKISLKYKKLCAGTDAQCQASLN